MTFSAPLPDNNETEEGANFAPRFDTLGLITAVVTDAADGALLMVAHMNAEALELTLSTGVAHYWSRSRKSLWKKGEVSGNFQNVEEVRTDCDQDVVWLKVRVSGHDATCHTGRRSCFYRLVKGENGRYRLEKDSSPRLFEPSGVYR
jgi:phosphoribosyl-AMP cyclohydrolase